MPRIPFLLCLLSPLFSLAQKNPIIPPAPEATSVFKFTEVPVSTYTGLVNTTIPFYEIQASGINIPINISYHARGIRVEEIASRVGIGWSLNYGGMISRQVRGMPDDANGSPGSPSFYGTVFTNPALAASIYTAHLNGPVDFEPDVYSFNAPGISGKFMFDPRDQAILLQQYSDTKTLPVIKNSKMEGLIITDNTGNKFYFGLSKDQLRIAVDIENTSNFSYDSQQGAPTTLGSGGSNTINSWHLMEIETTSNDRIEFVYETEQPIYYRRQYDKNKDSGPGAISYFGRITGSQHQVKEILFRDGKVKFTKAATAREDLAGAYALDKVEVFDKNDSLIRGYAFQYNYPATVQDNNQLSHLRNVDSTSKKRMFLHSIQEKGKAGFTLPPYVFTYSDQPLPNRFSNSQDNWGFYNGKSNGQFLTFFDYSTFSINRQVDTVKSEAGLLKRINYPTGGSVVFTYEHNRGMPPVFMNKLLYPTNNPVEEITMLEQMLKHPDYYHDGLYTKDFLIGPDKKGMVTISFDLPWCTGGPEDINSICNYHVYLLGNGYNLLLNPTEGIKTLNLPPGSYQLKVDPPIGHDPSNFQNTFFASIEWKEEKNVQAGNDSNLLFAAGKRIKRIEYHDQSGAIKIKEFEYADPATGKSSGQIFGLPGFYFMQYIIPAGAPPGPIVDKYGSLPGTPLTNHQGNSVGYSSVTEYFGTAQTNTGKIEYQFTVPEDGGKYYEFPYHLPIDNEWLRGKPVSTKIFEKTTSGYALRKKTLNKYQYGDQPDQEAVFFTPFHHADSNHTYKRNRKLYNLPLLIFHKDTLSPFHYKVYYQTGGAMDLYATVDTTYSSASSPLNQETTYFFDYDKHYLSIRNEATDSKGDTIRTSTWYPPDLASRTAAEQALVDLHRIALPIRVETVTKEKTSGAQLSKTTSLTQYKDWGNNIIAPELLQTAINANPLETESQFISYDIYGNPTEVIGKDGIRTAYVWGYGSKYPVSKVAGSDYNTVKNLVNLTMLSNAHQYTDQQMRTELNKIRTGIAATGAQATTLTYKPLIGMSSQTDANGRISFFEYDLLGRLLLVRDHDNNILKKVNYEYANQGGGFVIYNSVVKSGQFAKNNCSVGAGMPITYTVAAGAYTSYLSQLDADQKAQNDVYDNGQAYANTNGGCSYQSVAKSGTFNRNNCGTGTGSSYTYTVPAGAYTSVISQADADQKAQNDVNTFGQEAANSNGICTFSSVVKSGSFTRNNCGSGTGTTVTYTVQAGAHTSTISQADADQKAQNDVNTNGQTYANTNGVCPITIYASVTMGDAEPVFEGNCVEQYQDVVVRFYSNAARTIPYSVTNLSFQLKKDITNYVNGVPHPATPVITGYTCTGTTFTLSQELTYSGCAANCPGGFGCLPTLNDPYTTYVFSLVNSTFTIYP